MKNTSTFYPEQSKQKRLIELLKIYLNDGLEFDFEFKVDPDTVAMISWNDDRLKLGSTLWLGKPEREDIKVYLSYEEITITPYRGSLNQLMIKKTHTDDTDSTDFRGFKLKIIF